AANAPDIDVLAYLWDPTTALWFRRGVTHGILAVGLLPLVVTAVMLAWDRLVRRRGGRVPERPIVVSQLLLLSFLGVLTHPFLDFLNTYGMRWLMPFSSRWFYGDTLFIVDPWVWGILAFGIYAARKGWVLPGNGKREMVGRPAQIALLTLAGYIAAMAIGNVASRWIVARSLVKQGLSPPTRLMVGPLPVTPFSRTVVIEDGDLYRFGDFSFLRRPMFDLYETVIDAGLDPRADKASAEPRARNFLSWARFPFYEVEERSRSRVVFIGDARYVIDLPGSWASVAIETAK
ncbi:MAG: metal-dependent hydrolase, partial [Gemmatimonadales bacterium]